MDAIAARRRLGWLMIEKNCRGRSQSAPRQSLRRPIQPAVSALGAALLVLLGLLAKSRRLVA